MKKMTRKGLTMLLVTTMLAGLLVNSGVGILVLFKENIDMKENVKN